MRMYRSVIKSGSRENKVISPFSLLSVLSLVMLGAKDITRNQIRDALNLPCNEEETYYSAYFNTIKTKSMNIFVWIYT